MSIGTGYKPISETWPEAFSNQIEFTKFMYNTLHIFGAGGSTVKAAKVHWSIGRTVICIKLFKENELFSFGALASYLEKTYRKFADKIPNATGRRKFRVEILTNSPGFLFLIGPSLGMTINFDKENARFYRELKAYYENK